MHCIVLGGPMEKPKKLPAFFPFPTPPIEFWSVSLLGWRISFVVVIPNPYLSNKNFTFAKKIYMAKTKSSDASRKISFGKKGTGKAKKRLRT